MEEYEIIAMLFLFAILRIIGERSLLRDVGERI